MKPIGFTQTGSVATFKYSTGELKEWIQRGNSHGDVGIILVSIDYAPGGFSRYAGYGTLEHPRKTRCNFYFKTQSPFNAYDPIKTPEQIINPEPLEKRYPFAGWVYPTK